MQAYRLERDRIALQTLMNSLEGYARRHLQEAELAEDELQRTRKKLRDVERRLELVGETVTAG